MRWNQCFLKSLLLGSLISAGGTLAAANPNPPARPAIPPVIPAVFETDSDGDRVDDRLHARLDLARRRGEDTAELVDVELVFDEPVTQQQIDAFIAAGGTIDYLYRALSYGWNGRIALDTVGELPALLGPSMVHLAQPTAIRATLHTATQTGRVRPIWAPNFASVPSGIDGASDIVIAVIDSGVDETHTDLAGRKVFYKNYTTETHGAVSTDVAEHGTHVAGIALGTGAADAARGSELIYTTSGNLSGSSNGSFFPSPIETITGISYNISLSATWNGTASKTLHLAVSTNGGGVFSSLASASSSTQPLVVNFNGTINPDRRITPALIKSGNISQFAVVTTISNYQSSPDLFNRLRGVAPGSQWAAAKVLQANGTGNSTWSGQAMDELTADRETLNIKVFNLSLGSDALNPTNRGKVNSAANLGIVVVCAAGNDGLKTTVAGREVDDPGRAAKAITVASSNDINQVTDYSSHGFLSPGATEDFKPDLTAPGGSLHYSMIMSVDSNTSDANLATYPDEQANDYLNINGTSMATPFVAGCASLLVDALMQSGVTWSHASDQHPMLVKMLLNATATETNQPREVGMGDEATGFDPTLQRNAAGPEGFPNGKDRFEGYGIINPDAAVEGILLAYAQGANEGGALGGSTSAKRSWARHINLLAGVPLNAMLDVPGGGDFDLYLYRWMPAPNGAPFVLASGTLPGNDINEMISYTPQVDEKALIVVKRIAGSGSFTLSSNTPPLYADLISFVASSDGLHQPVELRWETAAEVSNAGFHLYRASPSADGWIKGSRLSAEIIAAQGDPTSGASYTVIDPAGLQSESDTLAWFLEDIDLEGSATLHGPAVLRASTLQRSGLDGWDRYGY